MRDTTRQNNNIWIKEEVPEYLMVKVQQDITITSRVMESGIQEKFLIKTDLPKDR